MIPTNYQEWRHCIEVKCNIPLTKNFITTRIEALQDLSEDETVKFQKLYGDDYRLQVLEWYEQALRQVG